MNWYLQSGKDSDIVISSRIRFARNLKGYPFLTKASKTQREQIEKKMQEITPSLGYGLQFLKLKDMDDITVMSLVEKHIVSPNFALQNTDTSDILLNEEENISIMINEEDHLRIQLLASGLEVDNLLNLGIELDERIQEQVAYAYHEKYGFLTACPTNVGTGLRASVMVHLPALTMTGNMHKILEAIQNFGMTVRGVYGEGTQAKGNRYQISNKQTLGIAEQDSIKNLKLMTEKIIEQERLARKMLAKNRMELENKVYRSFGILRYCKKLSSEEATNLLSDVRLGNDMGILNELNDTKINKMELYTKPANLQKYAGMQLEIEARDIKRAEMVQQIMEEK